MKKAAKKPLMNLPIETKELINQGIFSLFALTGETAKETRAQYVLYTDRHSFLLDEMGNVVKELASKAHFGTTGSVNFPELNSKTTPLLKLNSA